MQVRRFMRSGKGFTLLEMLVVLSVAAIMIGLAYSNFSSIYRKQKVLAAGTQLLGHLKEAKLLAIEKQRSHTFLFSNNTYTIYADNPTEGGYCNRPPTANEPIVRVVDLAQQYPGASILLKQGANYIATADFRVRFDIKGVPRNTAGGFGACTLRILNAEGYFTTLTVSNLGRVETSSCQDDDPLCMD